MKSLTIALIFISFGLNASPVTVKGRFLNAKEHSKIYLYQYLGTHLTKSDSSKLKRGKFSFVLPDGFVRGFYKIGVSEENSVNIILGKEKVFLQADLEGLASSLMVEGSRENALYADYQSFHEKAANAQNALADGNNKVAKDSIATAVNVYHTELKNNNQGLFIAKLAGLFLTEGSYDLDSFFGSTELSDTELTRGSMLSSKITYYFQKFVPKEIEAYRQHAERLLEKAPANSDSRQLVYATLIQMFKIVALEEASQYAKKYAKEFPDEAIATKLLDSVPKAPPEIGDLAPKIELADINGKKKSLSSFKGQLVLIDFWASWCGPCRRENPQVVRIFNKYKDEGFNILGVSLDKKKDRWVQAIQKDGLTWEHVSDLLGWHSVAAADYRVSAIPATFLVDENGYIIAKNLRGQKLESALEKYFDKK